MKQANTTSSASDTVDGETMPLDIAHVRAPSPTKNLNKKGNF